jgi:hypothetical protein
MRGYAEGTCERGGTELSVAHVRVGTSAATEGLVGSAWARPCSGGEAAVHLSAGSGLLRQVGWASQTSSERTPACMHVYTSFTHAHMS